MLVSTGFEPVTVSVREASRCMGLSVPTLYRRQGKPGFPRIYKDGGRSLIRIAEIREWEAALGSDSNVH